MIKKEKNYIEKLVNYFEENRFGAMTLMITFQSCYGSVAAMLALMHNAMIILTICTLVTMASNATFIAQSPAQWCVSMFSFSVITNSLLLLICLMI
ncbi:MAG: hypothetical protein N4A35_11875 [Flavobacteriales bacterium]|jgi:hypothetical protein|nr:hypothetical protein [Flavobacteriales bacterium]